MKRLRVCAAIVFATLTPAWAQARPLASSQDPQPIVEGFEAKPCQFPSAVAMMTADDFPFCTGTLVHPEIVLYAGHCHAAASTAYVAFGERADAPARMVATSGCGVFPGYVDTATSIDLAYCRLAEPVTDVPIVPIATGCEIDALDVGDEVTIVGFGASGASWDENGEPTDITGGGIKRYTHQTVETIDVPGNDLVLVGGGSSACFGDSGGPVFLELPDGSWRVLGAASTTYGSQGQPSPCGFGVVYELAFTELEWLESTTGADVTPCHDGDAFVPGSGCGGVPGAPGELGNTWADGCATTNVVEAPICGEGDDTPPIVEWITPGADLRDEASSLQLSIAIDVTDELTGVAEVWLRIDGVDQPTVLEAPPFTFAEVVFPSGSYELVALARDAVGNVGESIPLTIEVGVDDEPADGSSGDGSDPGTNDDDDSPGANDDDDALPPYFGANDGATYGCRLGGDHPSHSLGGLVVIAIARRRRLSAAASASRRAGVPTAGRDSTARPV
ncbi:MAG TPA: S1 family peptidase [Nannocystaceae bacterium]|nr:S1 family peptidase [Nannocystaceae bacterium]